VFSSNLFSVVGQVIQNRAHLRFIVRAIFSSLYATVANSSTVVLVSPSDFESSSVNAIFQGITSRDRKAVLVSVDNINEEIASRNSSDDSIIILGKSLIESLSPLGTSSRIVGGAFYGTPKNSANISLFSLEPSFDTLVSEIRKTGFPLKRLRTVVATNRSVNTSKQFTRSAENYGVELTPEVVTGEQDYARAWFELLRDIDSDQDAVLVNDVKYLESSGVYRQIIEAAWKNNILVVSALPVYSRRGVSIGFIPDLVSYGQRLYDHLTLQNYEQLTEGDRIIWADTTLLFRVLNQRSLSHIGLKLPTDLDLQNGIDLVIK